MEHDIMTYRVAGHVFTVDCGGCAAWDALKGHYTPFSEPSAAGEAILAITIATGSRDMSGIEPYFRDETHDPDDIAMTVYRTDRGLEFELRLPDTDRPNCWLTIDNECRHALITLDEGNTGIPAWKHTSALTASVQLAYILATTPLHTLMAHASSVAYSGKAYLFIAKSGTGKSTHSRMWLENIPDCLLLNDDHPIVRVEPDGSAIAYGSPWSGKTHCYKNLSYPIGAIVRIKRAPVNRITRQSPIAAYASISTSFSGFKWHGEQADNRHRTLEEIVAAVPCYELECRPDPEAAQVCHGQVTKI